METVLLNNPLFQGTLAVSIAKENGLSLADQVAREVREDIINGRLLSGMPLVESELVRGYNASRNTVRDTPNRAESSVSPGRREPSGNVPETIPRPSPATTVAWLLRRFRPLIVVSSKLKLDLLKPTLGQSPV